MVTTSVWPCVCVCGVSGGLKSSTKVPSQLVIPFFDQLCCCLPARWRYWCRCGINYDKCRTEDMCNSVGVENVRRQLDRLHPKYI